MISMAPSAFAGKRGVSIGSQGIACISVCEYTHIFIYRWVCVCVQSLHACKPILHVGLKWIIQQEYYTWSKKQRKDTVFKGEWKSETRWGDHNSLSQNTDSHWLNKILFPHPWLSRVSPMWLHLFARETTLAAVRLIRLTSRDGSKQHTRQLYTSPTSSAARTGDLRHGWGLILCLLNITPDQIASLAFYTVNNAGAT